MAAIRNDGRLAVLKRERLEMGRKFAPMIKTRRKSDVAADQSGNVLTNGELADVPHASEHRSKPSGMKTDLWCCSWTLP